MLRLAAANAVSHHTISMGAPAMHDHHVMHHAPQPAQPVSDDHGCAKCAVCAVANATLPAAAEIVEFSISPAAFYRGHENWSGNIVAVDPGIPKSIA